MGLIETGPKSSTCLSSNSETLYKPAVQLAAALSSEHISYELFQLFAFCK